MNRTTMKHFASAGSRAKQPATPRRDWLLMLALGGLMLRRRTRQARPPARKP